MREMIGRTATQQPIGQNLFANTIDETRPDYKWWDILRRGMQKGYELGGLFADPIATIKSDWTLGKGVVIETGDEYTDQQLADFLNLHLIDLIDWDHEAQTLGDGYLGVNPDGSLTAIPPNQATDLRDPLDGQRCIGIRIESKPSDQFYTLDEYLLEPYPHRHRKVIQGGATIEDQDYPLMTDELPIVHIPNEHSANEVYGHPTFEALRRLFIRYDDTLNKSLDGVALMGHPIPAIENAEDPEREIENNKTTDETIIVTTENGSEQITRPVIDFAQREFFAFGTGARLVFVQPQPFTEDSVRMLEILFLLMMQRSRIPEWTWGGAIASSKASVEAQMPAFERFIQGRQKRFERYLRQLVVVWLQYRAYVDPQIKADLPLTISWPAIAPRGEQFLQQWVDLLRKDNAITKETAVRLADVVDDPAAEVEAAEQHAQEAQQNADVAMELAIQKQLDQMGGQPDQDPTANQEEDNQPPEEVAA